MSRCWWEARRSPERFTVNKIALAYGEAVSYAKDAMTGLRLMNLDLDPAEREGTRSRNRNLEEAFGRAVFAENRDRSARLGRAQPESARILT